MFNLLTRSAFLLSIIIFGFALLTLLTPRGQVTAWQAAASTPNYPAMSIVTSTPPPSTSASDSVEQVAPPIPPIGIIPTPDTSDVTNADAQVSPPIPPRGIFPTPDPSAEKDAHQASTPIPTAPALALVGAQLPTAIAPPAVQPGTPGSVYWGVYLLDVPYDMSKLDAFERETKRKVSIVHWGQPWAFKGVYQGFQINLYERVRAHGSIPMLDWASWDLDKGLDQPAYQFRQIYQGRYDNYISQWASDAKAWGHPLFLRFDWEMNGWWFPWCEQINGNKPGDFVKAWRHVHDIFTQVGATNVTWVWSPNITGYWRTTPVRELYPGDDYVDWVGMDGFNWGASPQSVWQSFDEVFQQSYNELGALAPSKPLLIGEVASSENGGPLGRPASKAAWIKDAFATQLPQNFPKIRAVLWFNLKYDDPSYIFPLESSQASLDAFIAMSSAPSSVLK